MAKARTTLRLIQGLDEVDAAAWDRLTGADDPFVEHAFLSLLEESGSVGEKAGWVPLHATVWDGDELIGALPLYAKNHSYGEYTFDWSWADASARAGIPYYPKIVGMVPLTPATGRRLLVHPAHDDDPAERARVVKALLDGAFLAAEVVGASSIHLLYLNEREKEEVAAYGRFLPRTTMQYHWHNQEYGDFDDFLARFRSSARKNVRKERRRVRESGTRVETKKGSEITADDWKVLRRFYTDTCKRKWGRPYLTRRFFDLAPERLDTAVAVFAYPAGGDEPVAATLNFEKGAHLYGRYWGSEGEQPLLHFELCYYQLIERAITQGMSRFEAGAQGRHKIKRGLVPSPIHSAHWIRSRPLEHAVSEYLMMEARETEAEIELLSTPYKNEGDD